MNNIDLLFRDIIGVCHKKNKSLSKDKLIIKNRRFDYSSIYYIIEHFNWMIDNKKREKVKIEIACGSIADDAVLILFENIIYYILKKYSISVFYVFKVDKNLAAYNLVSLSNLYEYDGKTINKEKFIENYEKKFDLNMHRFKKICSNKCENKDGPYLSRLYNDVSSFLKNNGIREIFYEPLGETIIEIVGNGLEHTDGDIWLDMKLIDGKIDNQKVKLLNITTVSFTKVKFGQGLKKYLFEEEKGYNKSNEIVKESYKCQNSYFDEKYNIDEFIMVSAFQKDVTTRKDSDGTGGKGLTTLIKTLIDYSIYDYCYVHSHSSCIWFRNPYLNLTENGNIGFNKENDYNKIPERSIVCKTNHIFNGIVHNLCFVIKGDYYE